MQSPKQAVKARPLQIQSSIIDQSIKIIKNQKFPIRSIRVLQKVSFFCKVGVASQSRLQHYKVRYSEFHILNFALGFIKLKNCIHSEGQKFILIASCLYLPKSAISKEGQTQKFGGVKTFWRQCIRQKFETYLVQHLRIQKILQINQATHQYN